MRPRTGRRRQTLCVAIVLGALLTLVSTTDSGTAGPIMRRGESSACPDAREHSLPLPSTVPAPAFVDFEKQMLAFLQRGEYRQLGWCVDKGVRDTGPFIDGVPYGTHPVVRIWYSPTVIRWLLGGRRGEIPDGAMIVKEQFFQVPAANCCAGLSEAQVTDLFVERSRTADSDWSIMIKDSKGSKDGWFWGEFITGMAFDDDQPPFLYPSAGFGLYCLRCHAIAERQHTFAALNNIKGFGGEPITFVDDGSWRKNPAAALSSHGRLIHGRLMESAPPAATAPDAEFLRIFNSIPPVPRASVQTLPSETYDNVVFPATGPGHFIGSSQCLPCHSGLNGPFGPVMFLRTPGGATEATGANVSPYGEWRWSPMGLAGRDPIFYSQLEGEFAYFKTLPPPRNEQLTTDVRNLCLSCHGAMGKRQLDIDSGGSGDFRLDFIQLTDRDDQHFKYGALARDGISCEVCHRTVPDRTPPGQSSLEYFLENSTTGRFQIGAPDQIFGPFADDQIAPYAMANGIGITPQFSSYIQSSRLCGSCHTIDLPVVDARPGQCGSGVLCMSIEQATYLEWLNSQYQTEFGQPGPNAKSCQGCHMPRSYHNAAKKLDVPKIQEKIAIIEDETYPEAEHAVPVEDFTVRVREEGFARHELVGANAFLLQMFKQFWDVLGVRTPSPSCPEKCGDYMSGSQTDLQDAIDNVTQQAQERTATITASARAVGPGQIQADVAVTNLAGHRLPSGVGFRRAFIEVLVTDDGGRIVWSSGRTNRLGIIVDGNGNILPSEFHTEYVDSQGRLQQHYEPHYEVITAQDQAQIYEELVLNADGKFTTSFVRRNAIVKDNRLLPIGWTERGPDPSLNGRFLEATHPEGSAADDPDYHDGRAGTDHVTYQITLPAGVDATRCTVQATLFYQAIPPSFLNDRFSSAPDGQATQRLYYLTSNLQLDGTSTEHWKLPLAATTTAVTRSTLTTLP